MEPDTTAAPGRAFRDGVVAVAPLLIGVVPFGLAFGIAAAASGVGDLVSYSTSIIIFAGAAQLATIQLLSADTALLVVMATGLIINLRHVMYSAVLAPAFSEQSPWFRYGAPYLLTDQAFAMSVTRFESERAPGYRRWFYIGVGGTLWVWWQATTGIGILVGAEVPESWNLDFAIPVVFLALLVPAVRTRPALVAAVVAGAIATFGHDLPSGLGLVVGILAGIVAGVVAERRWGS